MRRKERARDVFSAPPDTAYWNDRAKGGWRLIAAEWEREIEQAVEESTWVEEIPYGLRVSQDCHHLVENPDEKTALVHMLEMIVADKPLSEIADSLNRAGLHTRSGGKWTQIDIFGLLPRLVEVSSRVYPTYDWSERRNRIFPRARQGR